ncbi:MAG TPA: hypothetical protein VMQ52_03270 [Candidatus Saccharimonadales bacterium]|jgi:hypothetical protein|nr:hypothetical protein [Candidatus Saccharimonadales bacterium]
MENKFSDTPPDLSAQPNQTPISNPTVSISPTIGQNPTVQAPSTQASPQPVIVGTFVDQVGTSTSGLENENPIKKLSKLKKLGIYLISFIIFAALFLLPLLPGDTSYAKTQITQSGASGTPADCTTYKVTYTKVKGFPLAYGFTYNSNYTFNCTQSGQGEGNGSSSVPYSLSSFSILKIGFAVDVLTSLVISGAVSFILIRFLQKKLN